MRADQFILMLLGSISVMCLFYILHVLSGDPVALVMTFLLLVYCGALTLAGLITFLLRGF